MLRSNKNNRVPKKKIKDSPDKNRTLGISEKKQNDSEEKSKVIDTQKDKEALDGSSHRNACMSESDYENLERTSIRNKYPN